MQRPADACGPLARLEEGLECQCGSPDCPAVAERKAVADAVVHVLAEQATIEGTSDQPAYLPGFGILPAESVRDRFEACDVDHTSPYPFGPTHPSNNRLYCRAHHLLKSFITGPNGWTDVQLPDATAGFTAPTGHIYTTEPLGGALFPAPAKPTDELVIAPTTGPSDTNRGLMMPRRKQTREPDRRDRIANERRERSELIAEEERQRQAWIAANYEPPPF